MAKDCSPLAHGRQHHGHPVDPGMHLVVVDRVAAGSGEPDLPEQGVEGLHAVVGAPREGWGPVNRAAISASVNSGQQRVAHRRGGGREPAPDTGRQPHRGAPLMSGEVQHVGALEHRDLDHLVTEQRRRRTVVVELPDLVEPGDEGTAELDRATAEHVASRRTRDHPAVLEHLAEVGGGRLRGADAARDVGERQRTPVGLLEQREDLQGSGYRGSRGPLDDAVAGRVGLSRSQRCPRGWKFLAIEQAGGVAREQFGDEAVLGRVERTGVRADQNIRLGPERTVSPAGVRSRTRRGPRTRSDRRAARAAGRPRRPPCRGRR